MADVLDERAPSASSASVALSGDAARKPRLLDLFCKAGGAARGYQRAGFYVVGVDIEPQPRFAGDEFIQADALTFPLDGFGVVHASPPCQANLRGLSAVNRGLGRAYDHADLLAEMRARLIASGLPYIIEQPNQGAQMIRPARYCGSSFGLPIRRHRLFESNLPIVAPPCNHAWQTEKKYWTSWVKDGVRQRATVVQVYGNGGEREQWGPALGINWMTNDELSQAIPPAFTAHVGLQLIIQLRRECAA